MSCTRCGMTNDEHRAKHRTQLHVHRKQPGGPYTDENCVTLCRGCHGREHHGDMSPFALGGGVRKPRSPRPKHERPATKGVTVGLTESQVGQLSNLQAMILKREGIRLSKSSALCYALMAFERQYARSQNLRILTIHWSAAKRSRDPRFPATAAPDPPAAPEAGA